VYSSFCFFAFHCPARGSITSPALRMPDQNIVDSTPCQFELRCSSNIGCTHTPPIASVTEASETLIGELYRRIASEMLYSPALWILSLPFACHLVPHV